MGIRVPLHYQEHTTSHRQARPVPHLLPCAEMEELGTPVLQAAAPGQRSQYSLQCCSVGWRLVCSHGFEQACRGASCAANIELRYRQGLHFCSLCPCCGFVARGARVLISCTANLKFDAQKRPACSNLRVML